jgi:streptogramin lyase
MHSKVVELKRQYRRLLFSVALAFVLLSSLAAMAAYESRTNSLGFGKPSSVSKVNAQMHQLRSSADHPFTLIEYAVPTANSVPHILAIDGNDHIWFSESGGQFARNFIDSPPMNKIGRLDQNGTVSEWVLDEKGTSPMGIAFDKAGNLWISERLGNRITCMRKDGKLDHYDIPTPNSWPTGLAIDSKGQAWFTETKGDKIGVVDPKTKAMREYPLPVTATMSTGIAVGPDDRVWIAQRDVNIIGMFDPATNKFAQYSLPTKDAKPCGVMVDSKGTVWFSERNAGKIGRINPDGSIQEFAIANRFSGPFILVSDRRGEIWFSELFSNQIGRFNPRDNTFEHFEIPGDKTHPAGIALDSKGNLWFAGQVTNKVSVIVRTDLAYMAGEEAAPAKAAANGGGAFEFKDYDIPTPQSIPGIVGVDRNGTIWFTEMGGGFVGPGFPPGPPGSNIGYIKDGVLHEMRTPTPESGPTSLAKDPCGDDMWFTLRAANKIARVRNFEITEFDIPIPNSLPVGIAVDNDHNVWVALSDANKIGRRTPTGEWRFLDIPDADAQPRTIFVDQWNEVWFAEKTGNHIGWIDKEKWKLTRWNIPTRMAWPLSLESDHAGNLWFAEMRSDKLGMLDRKTKKFTEYQLPFQSAPFKISYDEKNSAIWVSTVFASTIYRFDFTTKKIIAAYKLPSEGAWVGGLDRDFDDNIWFSAQFANKICRLSIDGISANFEKKQPVKGAANK